MQPIKKSIGSTQTERYLAKVCEKTFLSLWSYPNLYTPEGTKGKKGAGKELCDLLVVFENDVIIFSDKEIKFNTEIDIFVAWNRWRKKSINDSAKQLFGAEKWIKENPEEIYLDKFCTQKFPLEIDKVSNLRIHLIAVTKNSHEPAKNFFGNGSSGSFIFTSSLSDDDISKNPFVITDIDSNKTFVHVFDEVTLDILLDELDTTYDFLKFLSEKEKAIRRNILNIQTYSGEEELIAYYIMNGGLIGNKYPFDIEDKSATKNFDVLTIWEGFWSDYIVSSEREIFKEANKISYYWDDLIEIFATHIINGTSAVERDKHVTFHEKAIKWMANEGRVARTYLAEAFVYKINSTPFNVRSSIICQSPFNEDTCFILVIFPMDDEDKENYRKERIEILHLYGVACKYKFPKMKKITLIGTEPKGSQLRSEDVMAMSPDELNKEEIKLAKKIIKECNILKNYRKIRN